MSAQPEAPPQVDRDLDNIVFEVLRDHRVASKNQDFITCECGDLISRRGTKSMTFRHSRHQAWHVAWALREEGYTYVRRTDA